MTRTYNSKTGINGQRLNLVVNDSTNELYFYTCNIFDLGNVQNDLGHREVKRLYKEFLANGYSEVKHSVAKEWK